MRRLLYLLLFLSVPAHSQSPTAGNYAAAPDDWLLGSGQRWHYHTDTAPKPHKLTVRGPTGIEIAIVGKAKALLQNSFTNAVDLIIGNKIVWVGYKSPVNSNSTFLSFSIGKTVTSMAVGKAICSGKLSLTDSAESFVPELKGTDLGRATVQQLLKMSSGTSAINPDSSIMSSEQQRDMFLGKMSFVDILKTSNISDAYQGLLGNKRKAGETFDYHSTDPLLLWVIFKRST